MVAFCKEKPSQTLNQSSNMHEYIKFLAEGIN